jgi:hypothetical protein
VTSTLGFPTVGSKLISPDAPLWKFRFLPIHSTCASHIAHLFSCNYLIPGFWKALRTLHG